jgi:hypothetical protein
VNERGYQPVFCQALSARDHTVIHSTRHGPMEFGKDIISRDQAGTYHAFQLKGNPGTRLTIGQWNEILPQIHALMHQPVEPPLSPTAVLATPYLVTNGEVDEEVQTAIRGLNAVALAQQRPAPQLINRGALLGEWIGPIANDIWPSSTDIDRNILTCWSLEGADYFPPEPFHQMILTALPFNDPPKSVTRLARALYGAAIINEICLRRYVEANNCVSTIFGRALFLAAAHSLIEKAGVEASSFQSLREIVWASVADDYISLLTELEAKKVRYYYDYDHDVNLEFVYHQPRLFLLQSLVAAMALSLTKQPGPFRAVADKAHAKDGFIQEFMKVSVPGILLGEYAVPQILLVYWYRCCTSGSGFTDRLSRSSRAPVRRSAPNTLVHSSKGRLLVTMVEPRS